MRFYKAKRGDYILYMTRKEVAKVTHDINNVWHMKYKGKRLCYIVTRADSMESPFYAYVFINHGFNDYEFIKKTKE